LSDPELEIVKPLHEGIVSETVKSVDLVGTRAPRERMRYITVFNISIQIKVLLLRLAYFANLEIKPRRNFNWDFLAHHSCLKIERIDF